MSRGTEGSNPVPSSRKSATNRKASGDESLQRDRWFEACSLQRRVFCELRRASGTCGRTVIDDDHGKSGTSSDSRGGFQRLIAEIGLGKAGLVSTGESVGSSRCHN